jgi:MarR family 2-MHQ and catechol resistance regulon transcriptional repressor
MKRKVNASKSRKLALDAYIKLMRSYESVNRRIEQGYPLNDKLTDSQFAVLEALYFHGTMKQIDLAKKILKTPGNLTTVIDNLVRDSLVTRKVSAEDRRANDIELTAKGEALIATVFPKVAESIEAAFSILDEQEIIELSRLLKKLGTFGMKHIMQ